MKKSQDPYPGFESAVLDNGLTVHASHWSGRPWQIMGFLIHSGAQHDPIGLEGLHHFVEHRVRDSAPIPCNALYEYFEGHGGLVNLGSTNYHSTYYSFSVPAKERVMKRALALFGSMLLSATIKDDMDHERNVILGEFRRLYPRMTGFDLEMRKHRALMPEGHWLTRSTRPLGTPKSIEGIRQLDLQTCFDKSYTPANMSVISVGGMELSDVIQLISESPFGIRKPGVRMPCCGPLTDISAPAEIRCVYEASEHVASSSGSAALTVGGYESTAVLPSNVEPRVFQLILEWLGAAVHGQVRNQYGWSYETLVSGFSFQGFRLISIECNALALEGLGRIEAVVDECIETIGSCEEDFNHLKRRAFARIPMVDITGWDYCMSALVHLGLENRLPSLHKECDALRRVTIDDVRAALQWLRPERRWTLIVKP